MNCLSFFVKINVVPISIAASATIIDITKNDSQSDGTYNNLINQQTLNDNTNPNNDLKMDL